MKFEDYPIHPKVKKGVAKLGFKRPTDIQYKCIPSILKGEDLLAIAQTGTGKTAAFAIPVVDLIYKKKISLRRPIGVNCLVLVPTHELAIQIDEVLRRIAKFTSVESVALIGGVDQDPQIEQLKKAGLIQGGSLDNALVCDHEKWLNPPLRFENEPARHKLLDLIGDLSLLGTIPTAHYLAYKASHKLHTQLAKKLASLPD